MKFKIEIVCDNAVFQDGELVDELHRILHRIINDLPNDISVESPEFSRNLRDTNGNHVGTVELTEDKAKVEVKVENEAHAPRSVEFIICRDDNTWDTQVMEVPHGQDPVEWMSGDCRDSHVVFIGVFNEDPEAFERPPEVNNFVLCDLCQDSVHKDTTSYAYDLPARISYRVCKKRWRANLT